MWLGALLRSRFPRLFYRCNVLHYLYNFLRGAVFKNDDAKSRYACSPSPRARNTIGTTSALGQLFKKGSTATERTHTIIPLM